MTVVKAFESSKLNIKVEKEENVSNTRFTKYYVKNDNLVVMTAFHYKAVSDYFDMLLEEHLETKNETTN